MGRGKILTYGAMGAAAFGTGTACGYGLAMGYDLPERLEFLALALPPASAMLGFGIGNIDDNGEHLPTRGMLEGPALGIATVTLDATGFACGYTSAKIFGGA